MVVDVLNDMDADEVNSIDDTYESAQVAQIIKTTYFAMMSNRRWPHLKNLIQLSNSSDTSKPTHMTLPDGVTELCFVNYDKADEDDDYKQYSSVKYINPDEFLRLCNTRNSSNEDVTTVTDDSGVELFILNDTAPTYFTSFDDYTLIFDSYDSDVDTVLQNSKMQCQAYTTPEWTHEDTFIPDLPDEAFAALVEESKSKAMFKLKQMQDVKAEQEAVRQQKWLSRNAWRVNGGVKYPNFGRRGRK